MMRVVERAVGQDAEMLEAVIAAVKEVARTEVMPRFLNVAHHRKPDGSLFTEADVAAQEALVDALRRIYPVPVVGEEMTAAEQMEHQLAGRAGLWCVDPIDGTSNFVYGVPYFALSVALVEHGRSQVGVVYHPLADEMFYAVRGSGAFLNAVALPLREPVGRMQSAVAGIDFKRIPPRLASALAATPPYSSQRNFGAGTLDWCYVASGRFDLYLHGGQKFWDYAAGSLILEEAGGSMCTLSHDDFWADDLWQRSVIAARDPRLFAQWRDWVRGQL